MYIHDHTSREVTADVPFDCQIIKTAVKGLRFRVHYQHFMDELILNGHEYSGPGSELKYDQVLQVGPIHS